MTWQIRGLFTFYCLSQGSHWEGLNKKRGIENHVGNCIEEVKKYQNLDQNVFPNDPLIWTPANILTKKEYENMLPIKQDVKKPVYKNQNEESNKIQIK